MVIAVYGVTIIMQVGGSIVAPMPAFLNELQ
jgi:hypothetical protein